MCYTWGEDESEDAVGATGFDGALEGLELREEVVGHLFKLPAKPKCQHWHENGCLKTSSHVLPDSPAGSGKGVTLAGWSASRPGATPTRT